MTRNEWTQAQAVIGALWPHAKEMTDEQLAIQCDLLAAVSREDALAALRSIATAGAKFPPGPGEILAEANALTEPPAPTFDALVEILYARRTGVLAAQPAPRGLWRDGERIAANVNAQLERAEGHGPVVLAFVAQQTLMRLHRLDMADQWDRKALRESWEAHLEVTAGRERRAVVAGSGRGELGRLDPLALLPAGMQVQSDHLLSRPGSA